jgi:DNA-binding NarL/FixJ family response regulator
MPIRTVLVDDNPGFLEAAARFLATDPRVKVVGCVLSGRDALEQVARLQPDLVLMDVAMDEMSGLEATRTLKTGPAAPCIIMLTLYDNFEYRLAAEEAGADGYVSKFSFGTELLPLIHELFPNSQRPATKETGEVKDEQ